MISSCLPLEITDTITNEDGSFLFIKGLLGTRKLTLANVYSPNNKQAAFLAQVCILLQSFGECMMVFGEDLNIPLNLLLDSFLGTSSIPYRALRCISTSIASLNLHDSWRLLKPTGRDYTFFSPLHQCYSCIDYLFLTKPDLSLVT